MNSYTNSYIIIYKQNCYNSIIQTKAPPDTHITIVINKTHIHTLKTNQTLTATKVLRNQNTKRCKRTLINLTRTQRMQIFGDIHFVKPQNNR